ncbi:MAG: hypothetical protein IKP88_05460 [Lachnospiraceae bacterium]|nr:hypothetical protein [Lachnospiraceae bacterium]
MTPKWINVLRLLVICVAVAVISFFTCTCFLSDYCTDEIPATDSIFVYTVDRGVDTLNRTYLNGKKIKASDESRYILYEDIPAVSKMEGVENIYIFDDALMTELADGLNAGEIAEAYVAVPCDVMKYYGAPSGMDYMFMLDASEVSLNGEYAYIRCADGDTEWVSEMPADPYMVYYKYDEATWDDFTARLDAYLVEYDAISDVFMLVTTNADSADLQDRLMEEYPGSNYLSAEFARVFRDETNKTVWVRVIVFALAVIVAAAGIEVLLGITAKKKRPSTR